MEKIKYLVTLNVELHSDHFKFVFINDNNCITTNYDFNMNIPLMQDISINTFYVYKTITKLK